MKPGKIEGATAVLQPPAGWNSVEAGECDVLEIREDGKLMSSAWYPSPEEIAAIVAGQPVILTVYGNGHPPVSVNVGMSA